MRSKTSFFNNAVRKNNNGRFWPLWGTYLTVLVFMFPLNLLLNYGVNGKVKIGVEMGIDMVRFCANGGIFLSVVFAIMAAVALYSYLYTTKSAGMIGSLPVTRRSMFFTCYMTGALWIIVSNLVVGALTALCEWMLKGLVVKYIVQWFLLFTAEGLFFFSVASFCAVLTGFSLALPLMYALINFVFYVFEMLIKIVLSMTVFGFVENSNMVTEILTPIVRLVDSRVLLLDVAGNPVMERWEVASLHFTGTPYLIGCLIVGFILFAIALIIVKYRHMETATDVLAYKWLRPIFRFGCAFGCAMTLGLLVHELFFDVLEEEWISLAACMGVFALIGSFAAEMMIQKSFRVFKHWLTPILSVLIIVGLMYCVGNDTFGLETRVPDSADVASVELATDEMSVVLTGADIDKVLNVHKLLIDDKDKIEKPWLYSPLEDDDYYYYKYICITYTNTAGHEFLTREYRIPVNKNADKVGYTFAKSLNDLLNSEKAMEDRFFFDVREIEYASFGVYKDDTYEELYVPAEYLNELYYQRFLRDIRDGATGGYDVLSVSNQSYYFEKAGEDYVRVSFAVVETDGYYRTVSALLNENTTRLNEFYGSIHELLDEPKPEILEEYAG